jgi:uncharacterized protein with PhoU and TrkA domain
MADINVILPTKDATQSVEVATAAATNLAADMTIVNAMKNKGNSMAIVINATTAGTIKIKAGDNYPNAILGDLDVAVGTGVNVIRLLDISRFENRDGSIKLANTGAAGTIFVTAKRAGIAPVDEQ